MGDGRDEPGWLSWMRPRGLDPGAPAPDGDTIGPVLNRLIEAGTPKRTRQGRDTETGALRPGRESRDAERGDHGVRAAIAQDGRSPSRAPVDAALIVAPKQQGTEEEAAIRAGKPTGEIWCDHPGTKGHEGPPGAEDRRQGAASPG
ncbi:MAG: hypothetical protein AAF501_09290 [Pseudomonadota bacterium]